MTDTDTHTGTRITQVGTVMVPVSDQDQAISFFVEKLGFEKLGRDGRAVDRHQRP